MGILIIGDLPVVFREECSKRILIQKLMYLTRYFNYSLK